MGESAKFADLGTRFVHAGNEPEARTGAMTTPVSFATTFAQAAPGQFRAGFEYSRTSNPTRVALETSLAAAEGAVHCAAFASGCAALVAVVHACCTSGDKIVCIDDVYGGTQRYLRQEVIPIYGMRVDFVDFKDMGAVRKACEGAKMVWLETPTNPNLEVSDIAAVAKVTKELGVLLVVDNTFLSPYLQRPLELGADVVTHSCTKSIGGHSDVVLGAVCTSDSVFFEKIRFHQNTAGAVPGPMDCYLAQRGLKTLHVRMDRSESNAAAIAAFLEAHARVAKVSWPFLKSHPQHDIAKRQQSGGGMVVTFWVKPKGALGPDDADLEQRKLAACSAFLSALQLFTCAESLGAVESLAEAPAVMTHGSVPAEKRKKLGIDGAMVRLSVGIESVADLIKDLDNALAASAL